MKGEGCNISNNKVFYAHINKNGEKQTVKDHGINVGKLSGKLASKFGAKKSGETIGLLHDIGKCSEEFEVRLFNGGPKVDHATAGAKELKGVFGKVIQRLLGYSIVGHHSGLPDIGSKERGFIQRLNKIIPEYNADEILQEIKWTVKELSGELPKNYDNEKGFVLGFYIRMLYSALTDADFLDTEAFCKVDEFIERGNYKGFKELEEVFNLHMETLSKGAKITFINGIRNEIFNQCVRISENKPNLYSLTVPTGGGKTLSSLAFAIKHLIYNKLDRIIFVIPYTSIIEQNAEVYKSILGKENVLEHHSNFDFRSEDKIDGDNTSLKLKLASENWDIPIVVTTNVQFFESLFANKSSRCRKLHNISNSVIVIDEAQMLPTNFLKPTVAAINELVSNYNSTVLLSTATKPKFPDGISKRNCIEIIDNPDKLYNDLKRVSVKYVGDISNEGLLSRVEDEDRALIIVNTRSHAQNLYESLGDYDYIFHLSANMCPQHRSNKLKEIKKRLKAGEKCKVVSTQLIECGVDISFPVVYRSISGIDSIVQSAGRCNREGELTIGKVFVFSSTEDYAKLRGYQSVVAECGRQILENYEDPISLDAISNYFELLYDMERENLDSKEIMKNFSDRVKEIGFEFEKTARDYKLIEESETLIIPYDEKADALINELKYSEYPNSCLRKLQRYSISIHDTKLIELRKMGGLTIINDKINVLSTKSGFYDEATGFILGKQDVIIC